MADFLLGVLAGVLATALAVLAWMLTVYVKDVEQAVRGLEEDER